MDIQYPEALNEEGHAIKAESLTRDTCCGHRFRCPLCHEEMIPVLGAVRAKHFRHLGVQCQRDYYLHGLAEASFMEEYQKCLNLGLPFYLEMLVPAWCNQSCVLAEHSLCKERYVRKLKDLTIGFKIITQEARVKTGEKSYRRPDILLQSEDGKQFLWIEFFVTHEVGEEKQKMGRIVEIKIGSEKDIDTIIRAHKIVQSDDKEHWVRLYNVSTVVLDEPLQTVPPCDKYFVYEGVFGYGSYRIVDKVPEHDSFFQYMIALRLNWHGRHDRDGYSTNRKTIQFLYNWCENRFKGGFQPMADDKINTLIAVEHCTEVNKFHTFKSRTKKWTSLKTKSASQNSVNSSFEFESSHSIEFEKLRAEWIERLEKIPVNWIDMGLPSGVLWASIDGLPEKFEDYCELPNKSDILELNKYCKQEICYDGLKVIGPNGNAIVFKAGQYRLSSHRYPNCIDMVSINTLIDNDYLHIIEDDYYSALHKFRCIRRL